MKLIYIYIMIFISLTSYGFAQYAMSPDMSFYNFMDDSSRNKTMMSEEQIEKIQAMFIEQIFLKEMFSMNNIYKIEDNDDYDGLMYDASTNEYFSSMFAKEIAKIMAQQDILNFKDLVQEY